VTTPVTQFRRQQAIKACLRQANKLELEHKIADRWIEEWAQLEYDGLKDAVELIGLLPCVHETIDGGS